MRSSLTTELTIAPFAGPVCREGLVPPAISRAFAGAGLSRRLFMLRYLGAGLQQNVLIRALVEETGQEQVVITIYIASKIDKYRRGVEP